MIIKWARAASLAAMARNPGTQSWLKSQNSFAIVQLGASSRDRPRQNSSARVLVEESSHAADTAKCLNSFQIGHTRSLEIIESMERRWPFEVIISLARTRVNGTCRGLLRGYAPGSRRRSWVAAFNLLQF